MKTINENVAGPPTDTPVIFDDIPRYWNGRFEPGNTRCVFDLPDDAVGGGHLRWDGQQVNFLLPASPGSYEGATLGLPTLVYKSASSLGLRIVDNRFVTHDGEPFLLCGHTEMNAPDKLRAGEDLTPLLQQRADAGCNVLRSLGMGYPFRTDQTPVPMSLVHDYLSLCAEYGLYVIWCVFAGTKTVMPDPGQQLAFWSQSVDACRQHANALVMVCNEWNHDSQAINPAQFPRPLGILASRGSATTDQTPAKPAMDFEGYSARRDTANSRGFTNCDAYEFESDYPAVPKIALETAKPQDYGFNHGFARLIGLHGKASDWGVFGHTDAGVRSDLWTPGEESCMRVLYDAVLHG